MKTQFIVGSEYMLHINNFDYSNKKEYCKGLCVEVNDEFVYFKITSGDIIKFSLFKSCVNDDVAHNIYNRLSTHSRFNRIRNCNPRRYDE